MALEIYNTLSGRKEPFVPVKDGEVRMYVCGVTVYDLCHVGHARALVIFDVIYRYLRFCGYRVHFVRNFTDLDDKIIQRAREEGTSSETVAERYIAEFYKDTAALGLLSPAVEPKATEHVTDMIELINRLEKKGMAYRVNGDVYFAVERFPEYGKLSRKKVADLEAGARVEVDQRKKSPMDFALWKESKEGEPFWESPWGKGRPGWHVECSAMSVKYLSQPFDIHGGGMDLIFPHHENEIAQSEGAFDLPFARYWVHNGFVNIDKEKMSKSLGNVYTVREVLQRFEAVALRHYILTSHYRSPLDFSNQGLEEGERAMERFYETLARAEGWVRDLNGTRPAEAPVETFSRAMDDDFNTARALALIFDEVRSLNRMLDERRMDQIAPRLTALRAFGETLGLLDEKPKDYLKRKRERWLEGQGLSYDAIDDLIRKRDQARREKRWKVADQIRSDLKEKGITLEDTPGGTIWKVH